MALNTRNPQVVFLVFQTHFLWRFRSLSDLLFGKSKGHDLKKLVDRVNIFILERLEEILTPQVAIY